jgi:hypothetical protein
MKLNHFALAFGLSLGVPGAAQPADTTPKAAADIATQIASNSTAVADGMALFLAGNDADSTAAPPSAMTGEPTATDPPPTKGPQAPGHPQVAGHAKKDEWRLSVTPYLWFPGVHGTLGAFDRDVNVHASPTDLLSHFRFGLMAAADARWKRFVLPLDVFWVRLADDKALPFPNLAAKTADVKAGELVLTPKVGYRLADEGKIKFDVVTGFRYWHLSQNLKFSPSTLNLDISPSQNWVDPLVGVRIQTPLSRRLEVNLTGDVGGWGVGSQLDYQVAGVLGYKIKENVTLQAGYRYLDVNYHAGGARSFLFDAALSGVAFGFTINLK